MGKSRRNLQLAEPPRSVPLKAGLAALLGGVFAQVGWAIVLLGWFFVALDAFSWAVNLECNVVVEDASLGQAMTDVFEADLREAVPLHGTARSC